MQAGVGLLILDVMLIYMIIALDIVVIIFSSINCSTVICSPTIEFAILREATSETYGPRVYSPLLISRQLAISSDVYFAIFTFQSIS